MKINNQDNLNDQLRDTWGFINKSDRNEHSQQKAKNFKTKKCFHVFSNIFIAILSLWFSKKTITLIKLKNLIRSK